MYPHVRKIRVICIIVIVGLCLAWIRYHPTPRTSIVDFVAPFLVKKKDIELRVNSKLPKTKIELIQDNERLNKKIESIQLRLQESRKLVQENKELRDFLNLPSRVDFNYVAARIISRDPASGGRRVRIDRGAAHHLAVGQAVLSNGFLYGRILEVSDQTALVVTIIDPNCKVSVNIANTNINGVLFGQKRDRWKAKPVCLIKYLPRDFDYQAGMKVETSELGTIIPPEIPVGELVPKKEGKVTEAIDNLYRVAFLKPLSLHQKMNFVMILTKSPD